MELKLTQVTKNTFEDESGIVHIISKSTREPWLRNVYCVDCKQTRRVNAATFTVGERCPKCWLAHSRKSRAVEAKSNALAIYAALKAQVQS